MSDRPLFSELLHRRVPQILGIYVAATWMAVEIGDWMIERFPVPEALTSYIFIGMLALLPTVALLAWGHGAPGKDQWTRFQSAFIGINAVLAGAAMIQLVTPPEMVAATQIVEIVNDEGQKESYEVAREGFSQRLMAFFWSNSTGDSELDWLSYALPWSISEDLNRNPLVGIFTPFSSKRTIEKFKATGFPTGIGEPLSLNLQIARERRIPRIVTGEFSRLADGGLSLTTRLVDVDSGQMLAEWTQNSADWMAGADALSGDIRSHLLEKVKTDTIVTELTVREHTSDSEDAVRELIEALRLLAFDNDYQGAAAAIDRAVILDPSFANAHVMGHMINRFSGNMGKSLDHARKALALDYKLYSETKYALKANLYALQGQFDQAIKTLELTREIHPDSVEIYENLGRNYQLQGRPADAQQAYEKILELDPSRTGVLLDLAATYRLQGNPQQAIELADRFLQENPEDADAYEFLGKTHLQSGNFEDARLAFEEAAFRDNTGDVQGQVSLALLDARQGESNRAMNALLALTEQGLSDREQAKVLQGLLKVYLNAGQINAAVAALDRQKQVSASFMPPLQLKVTVDNTRVALVALNGQLEEALTAAELLESETSPPLNGLFGFTTMDIYHQLEMAEEYRAKYAEMVQFVERYDFPLVKSLMPLYDARMARWDEQFDDSIQAYDAVIENLRSTFVTLDDPSTLESLMLERAEIVRLSGRPDEAAIYVSKMIINNPGSAAMRLELAHCYAAQGFNQKALDEIEQLKVIWNNADPEYIGMKQLADLESSLATLG